MPCHRGQSVCRIAHWPRGSARTRGRAGEESRARSRSADRIVSTPTRTRSGSGSPTTARALSLLWRSALRRRASRRPRTTCARRTGRQHELGQRIARVMRSVPPSSTLCASFTSSASSTAVASAVASSAARSSPTPTAARSSSAMGATSALPIRCRPEQPAASEGTLRNFEGRSGPADSSEFRGIPLDAAIDSLFDSRRLH